MREYREDWTIQQDFASRMLPFVVRLGQHVQACFRNESDALLFVAGAVKAAKDEYMQRAVSA